MRTLVVIIIVLLTPPVVLAEPAPAVTDSVATAREDSASVWQTAISPTAAVLVSPVFPGWGQLYARNSWRAGLAFGAQMFFWTNLVARDQRAQRDKAFADTFEPDDPNHAYYLAVGEEDWKQMRDFAWWSGGALLILALDAYVGAHLFDFDRDPVPVPDRWDDIFDSPGTGPGPAGGGPQVTLLQWRTTF